MSIKTKKNICADILAIGIGCGDSYALSMPTARLMSAVALSIC
jgi:hypothetical protein